MDRILGIVAWLLMLGAVVCLQSGDPEGNTIVLKVISIGVFAIWIGTMIPIIQNIPGIKRFWKGD